MNSSLPPEKQVELLNQENEALQKQTKELKQQNEKLAADVEASQQLSDRLDALEPLVNDASGVPAGTGESVLMRLCARLSSPTRLSACSA